MRIFFYSQTGDEGAPSHLLSSKNNLLRARTSSTSRVFVSSFSIAYETIVKNRHQAVIRAVTESISWKQKQYGNSSPKLEYGAITWGYRMPART